jgi:hypothetical protein
VGVDAVYLWPDEETDRPTSSLNHGDVFLVVREKGVWWTVLTGSTTALLDSSYYRTSMTRLA